MLARDKLKPAWIVRVTDGGNGAVLERSLDRVLIIGRGSDADVPLTDARVSRRHCRLDGTSSPPTIVPLDGRIEVYGGGDAALHHGSAVTLAPGTFVNILDANALAAEAYGERGHWARWIAVLPVAVVASLIFNALWMLVFWLQRSFGDFIPEPLHYIAASGIWGYAFVAFGALVAPWGRAQTALVLAILVGVGSAVVIFYRLDAPSARPFVVDVAAVIASVVMAFIPVFKNLRARDFDV